MDAVMNGSTPDHGKWVGFRSYMRAYSALSLQYVQVSGDNTIDIYDTDKLPTSMGVEWLKQKGVF
jgi:hypothetical protein